MITSDDVRRMALGLPDAIEADHHGSPSYRVSGRIFATVPDDDHLHVMLDEHEIKAAVAEDPAACTEKWWGKRLACVRIELARADPDAVQDLLRQAWQRRSGQTS